MAVLKVTPKTALKSAGTATKAPNKKKSVVKGYSKSDIGKFAQEYDEISSQIKILDARKKELAAILKEGAIQYGTKDDKGSSYVEVNGYMAGNVSKVSMSLDQTKGVEYLEKKGLGDLVDVVEVKTINEERLEKAVGENRLTLDEVESFTEKKVSYQVSVKAVEEMPEVEQSELALAAKKK